MKRWPFLGSPKARKRTVVASMLESADAEQKSLLTKKIKEAASEVNIQRPRKNMKKVRGLVGSSTDSSVSHTASGDAFASSTSRIDTATVDVNDVAGDSGSSGGTLASTVSFENSPRLEGQEKTKKIKKQ